MTVSSMAKRAGRIGAVQRFVDPGGLDASLQRLLPQLPDCQLPQAGVRQARDHAPTPPHRRPPPARQTQGPSLHTTAPTCGPWVTLGIQLWSVWGAV